MFEGTIAGGGGERVRGRDAKTGGEHDGGHLTVADLDRERIHRKLALGGLITEYSRAA